MSLSTHYLEYGRHVARLRRRRRRRRRRGAYAPTSNTASHGNHEKINSWVSFCFPYEYGAPLGGPSGRRSSAINCIFRGFTVKFLADELCDIFQIPVQLVFISLNNLCRSLFLCSKATKISKLRCQARLTAL